MAQGRARWPASDERRAWLLKRRTATATKGSRAGCAGAAISWTNPLSESRPKSLRTWTCSSLCGRWGAPWGSKGSVVCRRFVIARTAGKATSRHWRAADVRDADADPAMSFSGVIVCSRDAELLNRPATAVDLRVLLSCTYGRPLLHYSAVSLIARSLQRGPSPSAACRIREETMKREGGATSEEQAFSNVYHCCLVLGRHPGSSKQTSRCWPALRRRALAPIAHFPPSTSNIPSGQVQPSSPACW